MVDGIGGGILGAAVVLALTVMVIRRFPEIFSKILVKHVEHAYDTKLEEIRGRIRASESAVNSAVTYLTQAQSELRSKTIASVESMWHSLDVSYRAHAGPFSAVSLLTTEEINDIIVARDVGDTGFGQALIEYHDLTHLAPKFKLANEAMSGSEILFVSPRLWVIFTCILRVHGRLGSLFYFSFKEQGYRDWRTDNVMRSILETALDAEKIDQAASPQLGGLHDLLHWLNAEFIEESSSLVRGGRELEHAVPEFHKILREQHKVGTET